MYEIYKKDEIGKTISCPHCGQTHDIKYGKRKLKDGTEVPSKLLAYYCCGKKSYLAGIDGQKIKHFDQFANCDYCGDIKKWKGDAPLPKPLKLRMKGLVEHHCGFEGAMSPRFDFICPYCK